MVASVLEYGPRIMKGISALIWLGETANKGTGRPLIVTEVPPSVSGRGLTEPEADWVTAARFNPNMVINEPGSTEPVYEAEFTT